LGANVFSGDDDRIASGKIANVGRNSDWVIASFFGFVSAAFEHVIVFLISIAIPRFHDKPNMETYIAT